MRLIDVDKIPGAFLIAAIAEAPTVDAVPVIRCKDCRWYAYKYDGYHSECDLFKMCFDPDDYCSRAERKEKDGE